MEPLEFFRMHPELAIAFSGGVDSAYLLYLSAKYAKRVHAYYVKTEFQPEFELKDAIRIAEYCQVPLTVLSLSQLAQPEIRQNDPLRCYYCKKRIFVAIQAAASADGFSLLADGTNADDKEEDRPGFRALRELQVCSPLREFGYSKDLIRKYSAQAGLFTHDKAAYACLATRVPTGEEITGDKLRTTELAEGFLYDLGFRDFRVRTKDGCATLQIRQEQFPLFYEREELILNKLHTLYNIVLSQPEVRT